MDTERNQRHYDIWLHWHTFDTCNLNCIYCPVHKIKKPAKTPSLNIPAIIRTLEKTNKTFKMSFSGGGEPFCIPNLVAACKEITKKHYIALITNLTSPRIPEFATSITPHQVLSIIASAHIEELQNHDLLNTYFNNFLLLQEAGFTIEAIAVAYPPYIHRTEQYKKLFSEHGIELKFSPFIGTYKGKKYPRAYIRDELTAFGMVHTYTDAPQRHYQREKICNAGYNVGFINHKGDIYPCASIHKKMGNIYRAVHFKKNILQCPLHFCVCPLNVYDAYLLHKAIRDVTRAPQRMHPFFIPVNFLRRVVHTIR